MHKLEKGTCSLNTASSNMKLLAILCSLVTCVLGKPGVIAPFGLNGINYAAPSINHLGAPIPSHNYIGAPAVAYPGLGYPVAAALRTQFHAQDEFGQANYGHAEPFQTHSALQDGAGNKIGSYSYVTPEGQIVRTDYIADGAGFRVASNALPVGPTGPLPVPPKPVTETPEVAAARSAHLAEYEAVKSRSKRAIFAATVPASTIPLVYAAAIHAPVAAIAPVAAFRKATLTKVVNSPGHAISYRVD